MSYYIIVPKDKAIKIKGARHSVNSLESILEFEVIPTEFTKYTTYTHAEMLKEILDNWNYWNPDYTKSITFWDKVLNFFVF